MTDPEGNSEFCVCPIKTLIGPQGETEGNVEGVGNKTRCFPWGQSLSVCHTTHATQIRKHCENSISFTPTSTQICCGLKVHYPITCESKVQIVFYQGIGEF